MAGIFFPVLIAFTLASLTANGANIPQDPGFETNWSEHVAFSDSNVGDDGFVEDSKSTDFYVPENYNMPQHSELDAVFSDQMTSPDSDMNSDEFSENSQVEMPERITPEYDEEVEDEFDRSEAIDFDDMGDETEFFGDSESTDFEIAENDTPAQVLQKRNKGYCHFEHNVWRKVNQTARCGKCLKCVCRPEGIWDCRYSWRYCPYDYCNNVHYHPTSQVCCCGKLHTKTTRSRCCGFQYYNTYTHQCCKLSYTVRPKNKDCPR